LVVVALALLLGQLGLVVGAPAALCGIWSASAEDASTCTCVHVDGVECPMHEHPGRLPSGRTRFPQICPGCRDQATALVTALTTAVAVLQPSSVLDPPAAAGVLVAARATPILDVDRPPASPPPLS